MDGAPRPVNPNKNPPQTEIITPLEPSDDVAIEEAARAFLNLPAPIETVCADKNSTFFHFLFSVEPKIPENAAEGWKETAEQSVERYVRNNCAEGVLVQAVHDGILRLEFAICFSGEKRAGRLVRQNLRTQTLLKSLCASGCSHKDWEVASKILGQAEDARLAV